MSSVMGPPAFCQSEAFKCLPPAGGRRHRPRGGAGLLSHSAAGVGYGVWELLAILRHLEAAASFRPSCVSYLCDTCLLLGLRSALPLPPSRFLLRKLAPWPSPCSSRVTDFGVWPLLVPAIPASLIGF